MKRVLTFLFAAMLSLCMNAQPIITIKGIVSDIETREGLPFASVGIREHSIGTATDADGFFIFSFPETYKNDTLVFSFIGYETVTSAISDSLIIMMKKNAVQLHEVMVYPLDPTGYLKQARKQIPENYPIEPFQTIAWYKELLSENGKVLEGKEGIFKSYYPSYQDTVRNDHQLMLYRKANEISKLSFMEKERTRSYEREKKRAEKKQDTTDLVKAGTDFSKMFRGPEMVLSIDLLKQNEPFLDSTQFKKFEYFFKPPSVYNNRDLIVIGFKSKRKVDDMRISGEILLDAVSLAIVAINYDGELSLPLLIRPVLLALGIKVVDPVFEKRILYEPIGDKWYPKKLHWNMRTGIAKKRWFSPDDYADFAIGQVFVINQVDISGISPIAETKKFDYRKKMEEQVFPEEGIYWFDGSKE